MVIQWKMWQLLVFVVVLRCVVGSVEFKHTMQLHSDYHMYWKFDDDTITVKLIVNTTGKSKSDLISSGSLGTLKPEEGGGGLT